MLVEVVPIMLLCFSIITGLVWTVVITQLHARVWWIITGTNLMTLKLSRLRPLKAHLRLFSFIRAIPEVDLVSNRFHNFAEIIVDFNRKTVF